MVAQDRELGVKAVRERKVEFLNGAVEVFEELKERKEGRVLGELVFFPFRVNQNPP